MSLKHCVICIAGDITSDIAAPESWQDANIERWCKLRDMTLVWKDMNKSVTHLVISRAAFRSNHAAVQYVRKDERENKKAKIVTYDWLEDSIHAGKAIQDVSAYDPGKPRDVNAMVAACSKRSKTAKSKSADELDTQVEEATPEGEEPSTAVKVRQPKQALPEIPKSSTLKSGEKEKPKLGAVDHASSGVVAQSITSKKQPVLNNSIISRKQYTPTLSTKAQDQKDTVARKPQAKANPAVISGTDTSLSWEARNKPRVFRDKTDQFSYRIELTHKEKRGERWILQILQAPNVVDKAFVFRAYQYSVKNKIDLREDKTPPSIFQNALELFASSFRSKTSYSWDERLVRAQDVQAGKWRYKLPAKGEPVGKVPSEFDPGHPKCVKPKDLAPIGKAVSGRKVFERSASKSLGTYVKAQKGNLKEKYPSKARKSAVPLPLKRKAGEFAGPEHRSKVNKTARGKFKSSEFVYDSNADDE